MMISCSINVTKINKDKLFKGKNGTYLDVVLLENHDGTDNYGNNGMAVQSVSKEERAAGVRGVILGNWKYIGQKAATPAPADSGLVDPDAPEDSSPIPF